MLTDSKFGFGLMRLPKDDKGQIQIEKVKKMVDAYLASGFNYFDTAYVYEGSEAAMKAALVDRYPREAYTIADKLPKWGLNQPDDVSRIFHESLARCGVDYFDFYLLHSINEEFYQIYTKFACFEFISEMKKQGKIKHIGFSYHDGPELLDRILTEHPEMEFVQLQINYLDWESGIICSRKNLEVARKHGIPVVVMEPVKGGTLAKLPEQIEALYKAERPTASIASWALRFVASQEGIMTVLSGMTTEEQMQDNLATMQHFEPITKREAALISQVTETYLALPTIGCTGCRYCVAGCPKKILIPDLFAAYNAEQSYGKTSQPASYYKRHTGNGHGKASECICCRKCENSCPQHLPITTLLKTVAATFEG